MLPARSVPQRRRPLAPVIAGSIVGRGHTYRRTPGRPGSPSGWFSFAVGTAPAKEGREIRTIVRLNWIATSLYPHLPSMVIAIAIQPMETNNEIHPGLVRNSAVTWVGELASAQVYAPVTQTMHRHRAHWNWSYRRAVAMRAPGGRCRGISYRTGARSCGTSTGGPVGGLSSRN